MSNEKIICSAIWVQDCYTVVHNLSWNATHIAKNIKKGIVICGYRHCNCFEVAHNLNFVYSKDKIIQGFLTSNNRFVDRKQAKIIAVRESQCIDDGRLELFSEDIY
jgi:hypothetical protein